ncbi:MAG: hypothetical protein FD166_892 [Bacteroidetes bacterium]|nr:MAG: hypothetical protein FD166_892 [Bacteroidota bacterium]
MIQISDPGWGRMFIVLFNFLSRNFDISWGLRLPRTWGSMRCGLSGLGVERSDVRVQVVQWCNCFRLYFKSELSGKQAEPPPTPNVVISATFAVPLCSLRLNLTL